MFAQSFPSLKGRKISFMDSTLRDGEQTPGVVYSAEDKLAIARKIDEIGIESMDAGFAAVSAAEREAIKRIVKEGLQTTKIFTLCRSRKEDIDDALECGVDGVLLFAPTSDIMIKAKFGEDVTLHKKRIINMAREAIRYAKDKGLIATFGAEDSTRTDMGFLQELLGVVTEAGVDILGFADTVGVMSPHKFYTMMKEIRTAFPDQYIKVHCHNDYGLANINSIAGVLAGADEIDVTIGGLGERTGNACLEEVAMALKHLYEAEIHLDTTLFRSAADLVQRLSGITLAPNKAIVGDNAFAHESGIHTHAVMNNPLSYEPFKPEEVGNRRHIIFGKHSGKNTVQRILENEGVVPDERIVELVLNEIKNHNALTESQVIQLYQAWEK